MKNWQEKRQGFTGGFPIGPPLVDSEVIVKMITNPDAVREEIYTRLRKRVRQNLKIGKGHKNK